MSATDEGRILNVEPLGPIHCGGRYRADVDCRIELVDNQGLPERYSVVQFPNCMKFRNRIPDDMSTSAVIDAIRNPRTDKWPYWGRAEQSRAEELVGPEPDLSPEEVAQAKVSLRDNGCIVGPERIRNTPDGPRIERFEHEPDRNRAFGPDKAAAYLRRMDAERGPAPARPEPDREPEMDREP